jgi:hypothetical protein
MRNLKALERGREPDLVTTLLRAIDLAKSSRSDTTEYLLKIALLNEGLLLAGGVALNDAISSAAYPSNCAGAEGSRLPGLHSARREVARQR